MNRNTMIDMCNITWTESGAFHFNVNSNTSLEFRVKQKLEVIDYFSKFLVNESFDHIIELGTYKGGLPVIFDVIKKENDLNFDILTIDIDVWDEKTAVELLKRNITFLVKDIFSEFVLKEVKKRLNEGKCLILCDGGDKIKEFNYFSKFIKSGDFIMAHDYNDDSSNSGWSWNELNFKDIENSILSQNLIKYQKQNFNDVAWACFYKKTNI